jgi:hypothetical protein
MPRIIACSIFVILCALCGTALRAQSTSAAQVTKVFAVLSTSLDTKTAARGDEVLLTTMKDLTVGGKVVIPKGATLVGHVGSAVNRGKDSAKSALAIVIDKAIVNGTDIPLQAIVAAIAAPKSGGVHATNSAAIGNAAIAQVKSAGNQSLLLTENSQGAIGYQGVLIAWNLTVPPPSTIFVTNSKSLKLLSGTQFLVRMISPQAQK